MLQIPPPVFRKRRGQPKRTPPPPAPPPATGPVLVAASFDANEMVVTLTFDRDVDGFNVAPEAITVFDGSAVTEYRSSTDVLQPDPQTVQILMLEFGAFVGTGVRMSAIAANGIVELVTGIEWAGVTNLELPFP